MAVFDLFNRWGRYEIEIDGLDSDNSVRVLDDVVIQYGELTRNPAPILLKSTCEIEFSDPLGELSDALSRFPRELFDGSTQRITVHIRSTASAAFPVSWWGKAAPVRSLRPLNYDTKPGQLRVLFYDGFRDLESEPSVLTLGTDDFLTFGNAPTFARVIANCDTVRGGSNIYSDIQMTGWDGGTFDAADIDSMFAGPSYRGDSLLADVKYICRVMGCRVYRNLASGTIEFVPQSLPPGTFDATRAEPVDDFDPGTLFPDQYTVTSANIRVREASFDVVDDDGDDFGFQAIEDAGSVVFEPGSEYNLVRNPRPDYALLADGVDPHWTITGIVSEQAGDAFSDVPGFYLENDSGNPSSIEQTVGSFEPVFLAGLSSRAGILLDWTGKQNDVNPGTTLDVELTFSPDGGGADLTVSKAYPDTARGQETVFLELTGITGPGTLSVKFTGSGTEVYDPRIRFLDDRGRIVEKIYVRGDDYNGNRTIGGFEYPFVNGHETADFENTRFSVSNRFPWLVIANGELRRRPADMQTIRTRVPGLYGPETRLNITVPSGPDGGAVYTIGGGRRINLTTGDTEISDVQIPADVADVYPTGF
jgi:hypothetical protein